MKRLLRTLSAMFAVVTLLAIASPTPAQAHTDVCAGNYTMFINSGLGAAVVFGADVTNNFFVSMTVGACVSGSMLSMSGVVTGQCALASGTGVTNTGHAFSFVLNGEAMVVTGQMVGDFDLQDDPLDSGSCLTNTAQRFLVTGASALVH